MRALSPFLRRALLAALAAPAAASCGGRVGGVDPSIPEADAAPNEEDARAPDVDASRHPDASIDGSIPDVSVIVDSAACTTVEGPPDGNISCNYQLTLVDKNACAFSGPRNEGSPDLCKRLCGNGVTYCQEVDVPPAPAKVQCSPGCMGRRPEGLRPARARGTSALAVYFGDAARLEAASVDAFRILRAELRRHGAPRRLTRAAGRAARDEIRHARTTRAIAKRYGGVAASVDVARSEPRSLEAIALENAVEGCVNETFGALTAMYQAERAKDPVVRAAMARIARDETRHADLAWEIARWIEARLSRDARVRVREARREAISHLEATLAAGPPAEVAATAGLPPPAHVSRMIDTLKTTLWA